MKSPLLLFFIFLITACAKNIEQDNTASHSVIEEKTKAHGVHSELLRNTMQRMNLLIPDGIYMPLQLSKNDQDYLHALSETATDLAVSVEILTQHIPVQGLSDEQRGIFQRIAEQLYNEAENVVVHANNRDILEMDAAFQRLEKTCSRCHSLFREQR